MGRMYWDSQGQDGWRFDCNGKGCQFFCFNACCCRLFKSCAGKSTEVDIQYNRDGTLKTVTIIRDSNKSDGLDIRKHASAKLLPADHKGVRTTRRDSRIANAATASKIRHQLAVTEA